MVHQNMFGYIDQRLRQITQNVDTYFGGISVILTGKKIRHVLFPNIVKFNLKFNNVNKLLL